MNPKLLVTLIVAVVVSIAALAVSSVYSTYVASTNHHNSCLSRNRVVDAVEQTISYLLAPKPGTTLTAAQVAQIQTIETGSSAILDKARC